MAPDGSSEGGAIDGGEVVITLIGLANSGRSSLVNALSCSRVASVSRTPAHTKRVQRVPLCPGVVLRDTPPATRDVRGTGLTHLQVVVDEQRHVAQALVAIDNVGKGAASQAVQNLNLVFGMPETLGIPTIPLVP